VSGAAIAFSLYPVIASRAGLIGEPRGAAQVAAFGALRARDAQRRREGWDRDVVKPVGLSA
jgi:hypothetical protein